MTSSDELSTSFNQFGLSSVDRRIGAWVRKYREGTDKEWFHVENVLLRIVLDLAIINPDELIPIGGSLDKLVNVVSLSFGQCNRDVSYSTEYFSTLSALIYAIAGNFSSAYVSARNASKNPSMGELEKWIIQILSHRRLVLSDPQVTPPSEELISYAQLTDRALKSGIGDDFGKAKAALAAAVEASGKLAGKDKFLLLLWQQVHRRLEQLSTARVLRELNFVNTSYAELLASQSPLLYPSQVKVLNRQATLQPGRHLLITIPPSTGKSLMGEVILVASLQWSSSRWLAMYLAPYRALTDQLRERMVRRLKNVGIRCLIRRGGYLTDIQQVDSGFPTILISTPEAFDSLLRQRPELYSAISACVFDEFHLIEHEVRGARYEGIISRFLRGASGEGWPKIIGLSAVIRDTDKISDWLGLETTDIISFPWYPTNHRFAKVGEYGDADYYTQKFIPASEAEIAWVGKLDYLGIRKDPWTSAVYTATDQWFRFEKPILVLSNSRRQTKVIASAVANNLPISDNQEIAKLISEVKARFPHLTILCNCLGHEVAYHNAALPDWVRGQIEKLISKGLLRVTVATTTLAEGVDLPFRVVILTDIKLWSFGQLTRMSTLLFRNIAGRGGRTWEYTEGDMVVISDPKENDDVYLKEYFFPEPYPLKSSIETALQTEDSKVVSKTIAVMESQLTAQIAACPPSEEVEKDFARSLYAGQQDDIGEKIHENMTVFTEEMEDVPKYSVLTRQSPLKLTGFGEVVLQTGLSPRSGVYIARFLEKYSPAQEPVSGTRKRNRLRIEWEPLVAALWGRISLEPGLQELEGLSKDRVMENRRNYPIKQSNFLNVFMAWLSGMPLEMIAYFFTNFPFKRSITDWLQDEINELPERFEEIVDEVAVMVNQYISSQWSWVFRGASIIAQAIERSDLTQELDQLAKRSEHGVRYPESVSLLGGNRCPIDRAKLDWIVRSIRLYTYTASNVELDNLQLIRYINQYRENLLSDRYSGYSRIRIVSHDLDALLHFLQRESEYSN